MPAARYGLPLLLLLMSLPALADEPAAAPALAQRTVLTLPGAEGVARAAHAQAKRMGLNVSVAIVDHAGRLAYFLRMDDTPNSSVDIAIAKATHAVNYRRDTAFHQGLLEKGNSLVLALPDTLPIEGGVQLVSYGQLVGAIGVSGVQSPDDGKIAQAGARWLAAQAAP